MTAGRSAEAEKLTLLRILHFAFLGPAIMLTAVLFFEKIPPPLYPSESQTPMLFLLPATLMYLIATPIAARIRSKRLPDGSVSKPTVSSVVTARIVTLCVWELGFTCAFFSSFVSANPLPAVIFCAIHVSAVIVFWPTERIFHTPDSPFQG